MDAISELGYLGPYRSDLLESELELLKQRGTSFMQYGPCQSESQSCFYNEQEGKNGRSQKRAAEELLAEQESTRFESVFIKLAEDLLQAGQLAIFCDGVRSLPQEGLRITCPRCGRLFPQARGYAIQHAKLTHTVSPNLLDLAANVFRSPLECSACKGTPDVLIQFRP